MITDHEALRHHWYVVAECGDVRDRPLAVRVLDIAIVLWRTGNGAVVASPDRCPHREAPLSHGEVTDGCLACPYHGWTFGADGRCIEIPSSGSDRPVPPAAHLDTFPVEERYGLVWVCPGEPAGDLPHIAADHDTDYRRINSGVDIWQTSVTRMTDNFLDISHFPWVHAGTFGPNQETLVPAIEVGDLDDGWIGYRYEVEVGNTAGSTASGIDAVVVHRRMSTGFHLPFSVRSTIRYETGLDHLLLLCSTPIDATRSYFTFVVWRNDDQTTPGEEIIAFDRAIGDEDRRMLERIPGELPLSSTATVSVQADRPSVEWRRRLAELLAP